MAGVWVKKRVLIVVRGEVKTLPARYSFTYIKNGERWVIVDHHSSAMPVAPK
jgi:hypothetical protein